MAKRGSSINCRAVSSHMYEERMLHSAVYIYNIFIYIFTLALLFLFMVLDFYIARIPAVNIWPLYGDPATSAVGFDALALHFSFRSSITICLYRHSVLQNAFSPLKSKNSRSETQISNLIENCNLKFDFSESKLGGDRSGFNTCTCICPCRGVSSGTSRTS